jgi:hypothetical protein
MANQFLKLRRSSVPGRIPTTSSLDFGEIALNTYDGLAFIKKSGSSGEEIVTIGAGEGTTFPYTGSAIITGSLIVTGSVSISQSFTASGFKYPTTDGVYGLEVITTDAAGNLTFEIPQTIYEAVKNVDSVTLLKGTPVHSTSSMTSGNLVGVIAADAGDPSKMPATYVLNQDLDPGEEGLGIAIGFINGVDTSTFVEGDIIYVAVGGGYTQVKPTGSARIQNIGVVTKVAVNGSGVVLGSGRANDVPNIQPGHVWLGNNDWVPIQTPSSSLFVNSASFATTSSYALTASYALNGGGTSNITGSPNYIALFSGIDSLVTSSIYQSGSFTGIRATASLDPINPEVLLVDGRGTGLYNIISAQADLDDYIQLNIQNVNSGEAASSDIVATADNGDEDVNYINLGINSSTYTLPDLIGGINDAYLYSTGNNLYLGNASTGSEVVIFNGGFNTTTNSKLRIRANNQHILSGSLNISGSLLVSVDSDSGDRFQVLGSTLLRGSGNTSATTALTVQNSDASNIFRVRNDATILLGSSANAPQIYPGSSNGTLDVTGSNIVFRTSIISQSYGFGAFQFTGAGLAPTSGINTLVSLARSFSPVGGNADFYNWIIGGTINQTGGATGITRGLFIAPTLTSAADWRSVEWTNNAATSPSQSWGLYGVGTAPNYLAGSLGIGTTSLTGYNLYINKNITGGTTAYGQRIDGQIQSDVTGTAAYSRVNISQASGFTTSVGIGYWATQGTVSGTITSQIGFYADAMTSGVINVGFYGNIASASGRWNIYMNGSAANYLNGNLLIGSTTDTGEKLQVTGTAKITGSLVITGSATISANLTASRALISSSNDTISGSTLIIYGSGSAQPVFTVQGSQGELFSVSDSLSGSLFSVNDISGLPVIEAFSDNRVLIGSYQAPALFTTVRVTSTSGSNVIYSVPTASYDAVFFEYSIRSGSNARAGQIMSIWSGSDTHWTETVTADFGNTTAVTFRTLITGSNLALTGSFPAANWTMKTIIRGI